MLAGSICALSGAAFKAINVKNARPMAGKVGTFLEFAGAYSLTGTGIFLSVGGVIHIQEILNSDLPLSEKIARISQILFSLALGLWLFAKAGGKTPNATKGVDDLVGFRKSHILNRHKSGAGKPGKTEFPSTWSNDKIINEVNKIANNPNAPGGVGKWDSPFKTGTVDGVEIRVDFYPSTHPNHAGKVSTAYPTNTTPNPN